MEVQHVAAPGPTGSAQVTVSSTHHEIPDFSQRRDSQNNGRLATSRKLYWERFDELKERQKDAEGELDTITIIP